MDATTLLALMRRYGWTVAQAESVPRYLLPLLLDR